MRDENVGKNCKYWLYTVLSATATNIIFERTLRGEGAFFLNAGNHCKFRKRLVLACDTEMRSTSFSPVSVSWILLML